MDASRPLWGTVKDGRRLRRDRQHGKTGPLTPSLELSPCSSLV